MLYFAKGILHYSYDNCGFPKLVCNIEQSLADFYFSLIPKYLGAKPQAHKAHVSVIRREEFPMVSFWKQHEGHMINFEYNNKIKYNELYFWLNVHCKQFEKIRQELGLSRFRGRFDCFHITLGNCKC